jgi:RNA polymerase sigma factor (sigma-70 family)
MDTNDDKILLEHIRQGTAETDKAFRLIYRKYSPSIYSYCRKMLPNNGRSLPEDTLQQAFASFFNSVKNGVTIDNVGAFVMTIARNLCFSELKHSKQFVLKIDGIDIPDFSTQSYDQQELLELIYTAIDCLSPDDKELVLLREKLGHSYEEISMITGLSVVVARQRTHRARMQLRTLLAPYIADIDANLKA